MAAGAFSRSHPWLDSPAAFFIAYRKGLHHA